MTLYLNICNCVFEISEIDPIINEYIKNRFIGFVCDNGFQNYETYTTIKATTLDKLIKEHSILTKMAHKEYQEFVCKNNIYIVVGGKNIIIYNQTTKIIEVCIERNALKNLIYFVSVKICDLIATVLFNNGVYCIHSSVCTLHKNVSNGVAMLGPSGVGKSSLVYQMYKYGELITNDDVAFFRKVSNSIVAYKNTQYIGFDDNSITNIFNECVPFIARKDGLDLDKNRIDLFGKDPLAFAESILIKNILIIEKEWLDTPKIEKCNAIKAYKVLIQSLLPFFTSSRFELIDSIAKYILTNIPIYCLHPCNSISTTARFILSEGRLANAD